MPNPEDQWPEFENALPELSPAMPATVASMADRKIRPMNAIEKALMGRNAQAITHPNGTIAYNREAAERAGNTPFALMAHELTHVGQINKRGMLGQIVAMLRDASKEYLARPDEQDAFEAESRLWPRTQDVNLPAEKK